jgi:hypothetical protein
LPQPRECALEQLHHSTAVEVDDHLVMLHALPALYQAEIPHKTKVAVAHARQSAIPEHRPRMHLPTIPSNLDRERLKNSVKAFQ